MHVIGAGVGRTGTYSLKLAINRLGFGPCHHMEEVLLDMPLHVPMWNAALEGRADWKSIYDGYASAVDWPTARFYRELNKAYPTARFILTTRSPESWADSFGGTIYELIGRIDEAPPEQRNWLEMVIEIIEQTGFPLGLDRDELMRRFTAHCEAVQAEIPADRLLVFEVRQGWGPLCEFLGSPEPDEPFPRTNHREEFWDRVTGKS
jgi:hypothetical protein